MALNAQQQRMANLIRRVGGRRGIPQNRLAELVYAAYKESGLNPGAVNASSGAGGLFQLLSSGYVNRANQLGGVKNPRANLLSILPSYKQYWQQHPNAAPGAAARDVERSGMGAEWYAPTPQFNSTLGGMPPPPGNQSLKPSSEIDPGSLRPDLSQMLGPILEMAQNTQRTGRVDASGFIEAYQGLMEQARTAGIEAGATPTPQLSTGKFGSVAEAGKIIGTPNSGTHTLGNWESDNAIDVAMPEGSPIYAAFNGTIGEQFGALGSSNPRMAGLRLHLIGPKQELYYAHMSRFAKGIKPGTRVTAGQLIGYSGSANGVAHLHLGSRNADPRKFWHGV